MKIFIRKEYTQNELRAVLVPEDIPKLLDWGFIVYVESCRNRIYQDEQYFKKGAIVTTSKWFHPFFRDALIIGLKTLTDIERLNKHRHLYFSHSLSNQMDSEKVLKAFSNSKSTLYDFERFVGENGKRLISFGYYAGVVGCILGLSQYHSKTTKNQNIKNINHVKLISLKNNIEIFKSLTVVSRIAVLGPNGNVGSGVLDFLNKNGIGYDTFGRNDSKDCLTDYDLVFNCVSLNDDSTEIFFSNETTFNKRLVICDISCDNTKPNNAIPLYTKNTTWKEPVYSYNDLVDIISISNLPSLMPKESSSYFSERFVELLMNYGNTVWKNAKWN